MPKAKSDGPDRQPAPPEQMAVKEQQEAPQELEQTAEPDQATSEDGNGHQSDLVAEGLRELQAETGDRKLVVVGSSAGGIQALSVLVSTLKPGFPAPIVLAQHLDPNRPSNLAGILERRTELPVILVTSSTQMEPGKIYVVPSNRHVEIMDGSVTVVSDHADRPRPSVDLLLSTAASYYGERLIAIILTGTGSDGAEGAVEVKRAGGTVIIQDPQTAAYPSMPLALPPTAVDYVADLENIGNLLVEIMREDHLPVTAELLDDPVREILAMVTRQANIDFRNYKPSTILCRISRRMAITHHASVGEYARYLHSHPEEIGELVMAFLIKVTEFLRDPEAFEYLRSQILPEVIEQGRSRGNVLRFWSAGCATGEEPYSLAILLADILGPELPQWSIKIFATDLDEGAVEYARRGLYPGNLLKHLPEHYRPRYFEPAERGYQVSKLLRQMIIFGQQDLTRGVPFPRIDLVVCRNLLIYFKPELQQTVLDMFAFSLQNTHGYLFLGQAETVRPSQSSFEVVNKKWKLYRCRSSPLSSALGRRASSQNPAPGDRSLAVSTASALRTHAQPEIPVQDMEVGQLRRFNELVLRLLPTGVAVIDRDYRILTINPAARRLLGVREVGNDHDFLHAVRGLPYNEMRSAIDTVFRERMATILSEMELDTGTGGNGRYLNIAVVPLEQENRPQLAVINVQDVTEQVEIRRMLESVQSEQKHLLEELQTTNRRLSELNKDLQDANEELQASNEELMLAQEELQATNEEFEATNEELQATNEELETNNEELQATNEELETTNEELSARTAELQELTGMLENERVQLTEMVELAPFYILLLRGPHLAVEAFNANYRDFFQSREVIGVPGDIVFEGTELEPLVDLIHRAYNLDRSQTELIVTTVEDEAGRGESRQFLYTIVPIHGNTGKVEGVVVYADDVTK